MVCWSYRQKKKKNKNGCYYWCFANFLLKSFFVGSVFSPQDKEQLLLQQHRHILHNTYKSGCSLFDKFKKKLSSRSKEKSLFVFVYAIWTKRYNQQQKQQQIITKSTIISPTDCILI